MQTIEQALLDLKQAALEVSARHDADHCRRYLADGAVAVTPPGTTDKAGVVAAVKTGGFRSIAVWGTEVVVLDQRVGRSISWRGSRSAATAPATSSGPLSRCRTHSGTVAAD